MIISVTVQYILLDGSQATGFRVKRRTGNSVDPAVLNQTTPLMTDSWVSDPAPPMISYEGREFVLAFWSLTAADAVSGQRTAQIQPLSPVANDSHTGGMWTVSAKAYYVWNFGAGGGPNAVLIDAFDIQLGDFIPDDFVDVTPDAGGELTTDANNGYIDTSDDLVAGVPITIAARDRLTGKQFSYWFDLGVLRYSADPSAPVSVGVPNKNDVVVHINDIFVGFAFYSELPPGPLPPVMQYPIYNPWWWIETRGGTVPSGPPGPWLKEIAAIVALGQAANAVSPELRKAALELSLRQVDILSAAIGNDLKRS